MGPGSEGDRRVVYGATCAWWDYIDKVAVDGSGLPLCPHCKGVLFEMTREQWEERMEKHAQGPGGPGYPIFMKWLKGKCFKNWDLALEAYRREN